MCGQCKLGFQEPGCSCACEEEWKVKDDFLLKKICTHCDHYIRDL